MFLLRETVDEDGEFKMIQLDSRRPDIIKGYLQNVQVDKNDELVLVLQIIDYLEESILIKKDAYEKLSREHLQKQLKYKFSKYNIERDFQ